jgi:PAS domain S-box-containing protein
LLRPLSLPGAIVVALAVGIAAAGGLSSVQDANIRRAVGWVEHTHDVLKALDNVLKDAEDAETGLRGFLLVGEASFLELFQHGLGSIQGNLAKAQELTKDNRSQQDRLQVLRGLLQANLSEAERVVELAQHGDRRQALALVESGDGKRLMEQARQTVAAAEDEEQALLQARRTDWEHTQAWWSRLFLGLMAAALTGTALGGIAFVRTAAARTAAAERQGLLDRMDLAAIMVRDLDGLIRFWTHGCEDLYGWTAEEAVGQSSHALLRTIFPEPLADIDAALRRDGAWQGELSHRTKDDVEVTVVARWVLRRDDGGLSVMENVTNITPLRQAEQALRESRTTLGAAMASMTDAVFISDFEGRFVEFNDAFATFHKFKNKAECAKTFAEYPALLDVFMADGTPAPPDMWAVPRALRGETVVNAEYALRRKDTGETWIGNYNFGPIRDQAGAVVGSVVSAHDITDRKQEEAELKRSRDLLQERTVALATANENLTVEIRERMQAEEDVGRLNASLEIRVAERTAELLASNKELEVFSYSVAHDLRAPLRAIDGFVHILLEEYAGKLDAEGQRLLKVISDGACKGGQLIDDILAFARVSRIDLVMAPVAMEELVRGIVADARNARFVGPTPDIDVGALPSARADCSMVGRVWASLIDNAIKFTASKPQRRIEVGAVEREDEITYFVRDNGDGFDMRYVDKLFGVFQRLNGGDVPGTGIGLAIVKRIVSRHGGRVWAEGKVGEGATVYFTLPKDAAAHG